MKLATLKTGGRDGALIVVSRDLKSYVLADSVVPTLQAALDNWDDAAPKLKALYDELNLGGMESASDFDAAACESPLPRAYQWADGSAYVNHVELVRKARGAELPDSFWVDPLMYQGGSDSFIGPCDDVPLGSEEWGIDFEGEIAVITGDVEMGATPEATEKDIRLLMLVNDV
ncbi:MAG: fumarylacetoacetate hydrolase family protein, partial [Alphaproteobacteria bacterium]|nr:fumarylacetoacetate hydrolase family protein [Alphaproteobacteria bacterium]